MTFDDRLATILSAPVKSAHERAIRWRQLVDIVSRAGKAAAGPAIEEALRVIRAARTEFDEPLRAAAARSIAGRDIPPALLEIFADDSLEVAAPLLAGQAPAEGVRRAASPEVRRFLDSLYPPIERVDEPLLSPAIDGTPAPASQAMTDAVPSIGEVVARIEQLRASRAMGADTAPVAVTAAEPKVEPSVEAPTAGTSYVAQTPAQLSRVQSDNPSVFRWECGPGGEIGWVDGAPRGPFIGRSIARAGDDSGVDRDVERAFARRSPFRDATLALPETGIVAGDWLISGVPAFAPEDGRFVGYRGIARRAEPFVPMTPPSSSPSTLDSTELRELVHEIKTPLNAIIGFAEIIDGQYLGPAHGGYRARAAEIVTHARTLLGAVDDVDFAARLRARSGSDATADLARIFPVIAETLRATAEGRDVVLAIDAPDVDAHCALPGEMLERLLERFGLGNLSLAVAGEHLRLAVRHDGDDIAFRLSLPRALEGLDEQELFGAESKGLGLRLTAGLAQIVGCRLASEGTELVLRVPVTPASA